MKLNEFLEKLRELFEDTDPQEISVGTVFQELDEWSSLVALSIIAMVKTECNKTITGKEIRKCGTVEELYKYIINLK